MCAIMFLVAIMKPQNTVFVIHMDTQITLSANSAFYWSVQKKKQEIHLTEWNRPATKQIIQ